MIPYLLSAILLNNPEIKQENIQEIIITDDILYPDDSPEFTGKCGSVHKKYSVFPNQTKEYNQGIAAINYKTLTNSPRVDNVIVTVYVDNQKDKFI